MDESDPCQTIISETSPINDVTTQIRNVVAEIRQLREEYSADLRRKWRELLASNPKTVVWYKKTSTIAFRKAKWKKIPTGRHKVIRVRVHLKARPAWVRVRVPVDRNDPLRGTIRKLVFMPNFRPYVLREKIVPIYQKLILRPAGFRQVTVRVKQTKETYDWSRIKPAYIVFKVERQASLDAALDQAQGKLKSLHQRLRKLVQQPHRLVAHSDTGWIPPSWREYYYQAHRYVEPYEDVYAEAFKPELQCVLSRVGSGWFPHDGGAYNCAFIGAVGLDSEFASITSESALLQCMRRAERGDYTWSSGRRLPFVAKDMLIPRSVVGQMKLLDASTDQVDEQLEALAASTVRSLRNKSDYVFNLPRSIGELKDSKGTFKQGYDFLRWVARGTRTRNSLPQAAKVAGSVILERTGSASLAIVAAFLAWKFAIQPTIQDCLTFKSHTAEWLLATRRHLMETIKTLENLSSNILHIRSKFRATDAFKQKSLTNLAEHVGMSDDVIVEMTQSTVFSSPALLVECQSGGPPEELQHLSQYHLESIDWTPYTGCSAMQNLPGARLDIARYGSGGPDDGPVASLAAPANLVTASCQFLNERWASATKEIRTASSASLREGIGITNLDDLKACYERQAWPKAEVTGYLKNQIEGVAFARYVFSDVLEFLEMDRQNSGLESLLKLVTQLCDWDKLFDAAYKTASKDKSFVAEQVDRIAAIEASWDLVYVAWQLTPLSFIYDWFTTSDSIVTILNNFETEYFVPAPPAMEGIWVTKRCELLAGRPGLTIYSSKMQHYVSEWWTGCIRQQTYAPTSSGGGLRSEQRHYVASPKTVMSSMKLIYKPDREVQLARSGLYVAKRGEFISGGWETFLPQIQVKLTTGKVGTLLGLLAELIAPRK